MLERERERERERKRETAYPLHDTNVIGRR